MPNKHRGTIMIGPTDEWGRVIIQMPMFCDSCGTKFEGIAYIDNGSRHYDLEESTCPDCGAVPILLEDVT